MSALFISYTDRDPEGEAWADRLAEWSGDWGYGFFRDKHPGQGISAGEDWLASLYHQLSRAQLVISLCTRHYECSRRCICELAIAVESGKTVIPIQLLRPDEKTQSQPLPSMLQTRQAIRVPDALHPTPEQLAEVKISLRRILEENLDWQALQPWDTSLPPYPGLRSFEAAEAPVFFGRDGEIERVRERLASLALRSRAFLLLLGASGTGKSSLVRAGVVPRLRADRERRWLVLEPFKPGLSPFSALRWALLQEPLAAVEQSTNSGGEEAIALIWQLQSLSNAANAPVVLVIDQFEELLSDPSRAGEAPGEGERFLAFLEALLRRPEAGVNVLATLRTDFLDPVHARWPNLLSLATIETILPVRQEDFGQLITRPAARLGLRLQPGLSERMVAESRSQNALPLLAFILQELLHRKEKRGRPVRGPRGEYWDLSLADFEEIGGFAGAVSFLANNAFTAASPSEKQISDIRESFLQMCRIDGSGQATKRLARWEDTSISSRGILQQFINARILCSSGDGIEITHDSLLRCWPILVQWIENSREFLVWRRQVELDAEQWHRCIDDEKTDLLLSGLKLRHAREWLDKCNDFLRSEIKEFIEASIMHAETVGSSLIELARSFGLSSIVEQYHKQEEEYQDILSRVSELKKALDRATKKRDEAQRLLLNEIPKVFISYASEDEKEARKTHKLLSKTGFQCWFDKETLVPGVDWDQEIRRAIRETDFIIILVSTRSRNKRGYMQREIKLALQVNEEIPENQAFIIPARIEECEIPHQLSRYHYCDIFDEGGEQRLAESILIHWNSRSQSLRDQGD